MMLNGKIKYILVFFLLIITFINPSSAIISDIDDTTISNSNTPVAQTEYGNMITNFVSSATSYIINSDIFTITNIIIDMR